jgi:hypothetical protein
MQQNVQNFSISKSHVVPILHQLSPQRLHQIILVHFHKTFVFGVRKLPKATEVKSGVEFNKTFSLKAQKFFPNAFKTSANENISRFMRIHSAKKLLKAFQKLFFISSQRF